MFGLNGGTLPPFWLKIEIVWQINNEIFQAVHPFHGLFKSYPTKEAVMTNRTTLSFSHLWPSQNITV